MLSIDLTMAWQWFKVETPAEPLVWLVDLGTSVTKHI